LAADFNNNLDNLNRFDHSKVMSVDLNSVGTLRRAEKAIITGSEKERLVGLALGRAYFIGLAKLEIREVIGLEIEALGKLLLRMVSATPLSLEAERFLDNTDNTELAEWGPIIGSLHSKLSC